MVYSFTHLRLLVDDFEGCLAFYRDTLGMEVSLEAGEGIYTEFKTGEVILSLYSRELMASVVGEQAAAAERPQDTVALIFAVDDVDASFKKIQAKGVEFVTEPHNQGAWFLRVAHLRDPDGNLIEINAPLKGA